MTVRGIVRTVASTVGLWLIQLYLLLAAIGVIIAPAIHVYVFAGLGWAVLVTIAWVGVLVLGGWIFMHRLGHALAAAVVEDVKVAARELEDSEEYETGGE